MFGLEPDTFRNIKEAIARIPAITKVILYGSRAKGNYRKGSDIDITLLGKNLTLKNSVYPLMDELEELYLPYTFDISIFRHIDNDDLVEHIGRVGKVFYKRERGLSEGWEQVPLGNVCGFQNGFAFKSKLFKPEGIPVLRISSIQNEEISDNRLVCVDRTDFAEDLTRYEVKDGDMLIAMSGATTGKIGFNNTGITFLLNQRVGKFIPSNKLDIKFLFDFLLTRIEENLKMSAGSAQPNLSTQQIKEFPVPLPPLPEQKRIVAILDEAFSGINKAIANAEKNLANARELFESYLNNVFTLKGEGWNETSLSDEIELLTGFAFKSKKYTSDGVRLLRGDNIVQDAFRWEGVKKWSLDDVDSYLKYQLQNGDVVLAMDRTWVKAGLKFSQISKEDLPCLLVQRVARLRCADKLDSSFLKYLIGSQKFTSYVLSIQTGSGVPHISGKQIKAFKFNKPELSTQKKISVNLSKLHTKTKRLEVLYKKKLKALTELKQSILQKAFSGELTTDTTQ